MVFKKAAIGLTLPFALFSSVALGQTVDGSDYDSPNGGPPASYFAAASTMPVAALQAAAAKATKVPSYATYPVSQDDNAKKSTIHSDWASFSQVSIPDFLQKDRANTQYRARPSPGWPTWMLTVMALTLGARYVMITHSQLT